MKTENYDLIKRKKIGHQKTEDNKTKTIAIQIKVGLSEKNK